MSRRRPHRPATYDDLKAVPDGLVAEIVHGELVTSPRPAMPHALAASALGGLLGSSFHTGGPDTPGGWWIVDEPELHLGPDILVPDLAGWRRERMPRVPRTASVELAPDWVCEVISPSSAIHDRVGKLAIYAREQVPFVWLIEPNQKVLEVLVRQERGWNATYHGGDDRVRAVPFDAIELELRHLWIEDDPAP